ncbi:MAG: DNA-directed RNA polymerase [Peltula sp. TS41687]|nr:MAG: DNA-directed RNA polymerase [Peltula sp. TS41687]
MLLRAARRRKAQADPYGYLRPLTDQLLLPWLCPAQYHRSHHSEPKLLASDTIATTSGVRREEEQHIRRSVVEQSRSWRMQRRNLATAVAERLSSYEEYVPFEDSFRSMEGWPTSNSQRWPGSARLSDISPLDTSSLVDITSAQPRSKLPSRVKVVNGMSGDIREIHMTLEACLKTDRFERAAVILRRLVLIYPPEAPELLAAHNHYLTVLVTYLLRNRSESHLKSMQTFFEVDMTLNRVKPSATTYALLLKASIWMLQGPELERTIRRYMDLATLTGHDEEVFALPILSDAELNSIAQVCPTEYYDVEAPPSGPSSPGDEINRLRAIPDLRPVAQKGLGLESLKKAVSIFTTAPLPYPDDLKGTKEEKDLAYAIMRQKRIEEDSLLSALERWQEESKSLQRLGLNTVLQTKPVGAMMWDWHVLLKAELQKELERVNETEGKDGKSQEEIDRRLYGPFLRVLSVDKISAITILTAMSLLSANLHSRAIPVSMILQDIADAMYQESTSEAIQKQAILKYSGRPNTAERQQKLAKLMKRRRKFDALARGISEHGRGSLMPEETSSRTWTPTIKIKVGAALVSMLLRVAKITAIRTNLETKEEVPHVEPAFFHSYQTSRGKKMGVFMANAQLAEKLRTEPASHSLARHLPMVVEPRPWKAFSDGGFLQYAVNVMRIKDDGFQREYIDAAARRGDMVQVFAGLDVLARTPWRVNRAVFDVMAEAWNSGDAIANIAPAEPQLEDPPEPDPSVEPTVRRQWIRALKEVDNRRGGFHSLRCFQNFQLEVARAYLNEKFYYPHNVDFRGRAYPTPPYLNHLGADNARGLLIFGDGKELGQNGLDWLKVHLSNVYGYDKVSFEERRDFTTKHLADIYDSASNPLKGGRWWLTAEDPWQCLATCIELKNALESPDPTRFVSHLPVHQDGTCNGLQHYAALGGDEWGARQVNLEPGERPADVYNAVAELVTQQVAKDAEEGKPDAQFLVGKITRKIVKTTVMTNVYGVTYIGAVAQVQKLLKAHVPELQEAPAVRIHNLSHYLVPHIFHALSRMFHGAQEIQIWLAECAGRISDSVTPEQLGRFRRKCSDPNVLSKVTDKDDDICCKTTVVWTTPLKMPVAQPYYKDKIREVVTNLQRVYIKETRNTSPVDKRKQIGAFPPNFIHSLDASHMLLSALRCEEERITFAAVHDSFWTHACDVDTMNSILRDAFIRIHREDVMGRLAEEFRARYKGCLRLAKLNGNTAAAKAILAWRRAQTTTKKYASTVLTGRSRVRELLREYERQRLLQSDKTEDRELARTMVTPASIFEELGGEEDLMSEKKIHLSEPKDNVDHKDDSGEDPVKAMTEVDQTLIDADIEAEADQERDDLATSDDIEAAEVDAQVDVEEERQEEEAQPLLKIPKPKARRAPTKISVWLPLTFPPIPKKGGYDVSRLAGSKYFFC